MADLSVLKDLIETLEDGRKGFSQGAEKLADDNNTRLADTFRELSQQRATFSGELRQIASQMGETIEEDGSASAAMHRGWMSLKDAIAGSDPDGVLDAAEQGEDHAKEEYEKALKNDDLAPQARTVVQRQYDDIKSAHDRVKALRDSNN